MDSMRSLNTSLPSSTPHPQPPEQLLQQFKSAALSVTNLYKNAVYEQSQAKQSGYQEAIEDLLHFLDKENLGLGDGEGWRVRQWATERSDGMGNPPSDDDDHGDVDKRARSNTPTAVRKEPREPMSARQPSRSASPPKDGHVTSHQPTPPQHGNDANAFDKPTVFTFTAGPTLPQGEDVDMQSDNPPPSSQDSFSVLSRNPRQQHRHNNMSRSNQCTPTREPSVGLGSKRKLTFPDFFDLSGANTRDMFGGGKRGRFT